MLYTKEYRMLYTYFQKKTLNIENQLFSVFKVWAQLGLNQ